MAVALAAAIPSVRQAASHQLTSDLCKRSHQAIDGARCGAADDQAPTSSGLPVVDANGALVRMIAEGNLPRRTELATQKERSAVLTFLLGPGRAATEFTHAHGRIVGEVMTPGPISVTGQTSLCDIVVDGMLTDYHHP